jgi:hypothetical protein
MGNLSSYTKPQDAARKPARVARDITRCTRCLFVALPLIFLDACAPPDPRAVSECRASAQKEGRGHALISSDIGELVEACMLAKGYLVKEGKKECSDDISGPMKAECYYPNTLTGRLWASLVSDTD